MIFTLPVNLLAGILFASLGLSYTSRAQSISQLTYFFSLFIMPMFWFSGAFFPLDDLPRWAEVLAWLTPIFHTVELDRALINGNVAWSDLLHLAVIVVLILARVLVRALVHASAARTVRGWCSRRLAREATGALGAQPRARLGPSQFHHRQLRPRAQPQRQQRRPEAAADERRHPADPQ